LPLDAPELTAKLEYFKERGFRLGWRIRAVDAQQIEERAQSVGPATVPWDVLKIVSTDFDGLQIAKLLAEVKKLKSASGAPLQLLACDIETTEDFQVFFQAGCDFFQGPFVTSRKNFHPPKSEIDRVKLMGLLNRLREGAENEELAEGLRQDPVLTYKILRYVNSAAMGMQKEITTTAQALTVLGREKFYRWLSLLLFDVTHPGYAEKSLIEQALVRARLMEQISATTKAAGVIPDQLFLTGLFSLLHLMLGQAVEQVLEQISLPQAVRQALLSETGPLAPYLALAIACEQGDQEQIALCASACGVDAALVNDQLLLALSWANEIAKLNS
jgi:EAL and modified HD-GYP domain-containing signal transduction protein